MTRPRPLFWLALILLLLLAPACGGGGGGGGGTGTGSGDGGGDDGGGDDGMVDPQAVADSKTILEGCVLPGLADGQALAALVHRILTGNAAGDAVMLGPDGVQVDDGGENPILRVRWEQDANMDGAPELEGEILFFDAMDEEIQPFSDPELMALEMDIAALGSLLSSLPAGAYLRVLATDPVAGVIGTVQAAIVAGAPGTSSGVVAISGDPDCALELSWDGVALSTFEATYPTGVFQFMATAPEGNLEGEVDADGTDVGSAATTLDGANAVDWTLDLMGGVATAL